MQINVSLLIKRNQIPAESLDFHLQPSAILYSVYSWQRLLNDQNFFLFKGIVGHI